MSLLLEPEANVSVGILQKITATNDFDGTAPAGTPTLVNGLTKYPTGTGGGLFNFENLEPVVLTGIHLSFGSSIAFTVSIVNLDEDGAALSGEAVEIASGTATKYVSTEPYRLLQGQALKVVTTSGANAMVGWS